MWCRGDVGTSIPMQKSTRVCVCVCVCVVGKEGEEKIKVDAEVTSEGSDT